MYVWCRSSYKISIKYEISSYTDGVPHIESGFTKEPHKIVNTLKQDTNISLENDMMVDDMILDDYVQDVNYVEEYIANNDNADDDDDGNDSDGEYLLTTY